MSALCVEQPPSSDGWEVAVYVAFIVFGLGSWISINSIFVQSSFLVYSQPEGWALSTWIVVALQVANLLVVLLLRLLRRPAWAALSGSLLALGLGASAVLAAGAYHTTAWVLGQERSLGLLSMTFVAGVASCGSSLVFYPFASVFPRRYTTALAIGEGLSGSAAGLLGMLQNAKGTEDPGAAFCFAGALCVSAMLALVFLERHSSAKRLRVEQPFRELEAPTWAGTCLELRRFSPGFLALFLGAALNFGLLPALNPKACAEFKDSQSVLLWSNAVIYGFDPFSRILTAFTNFRHLNALSLLFSASALLVAALAKWPSLLGDRAYVVPLANMVFAASFGYARTMAFLILKEAADATRLYWMAGVALQSGSFVGSAVSLLLVEVFKVF